MPDGKGGAIDFLRADDKLTGDVVERLKKPIKRGNLQEETASTSQPVLGGFFRETIQKKKPAAAKKVAPTKAPPLKGLVDPDENTREQVLLAFQCHCFFFDVFPASHRDHAAGEQWDKYWRGSFGQALRSKQPKGIAVIELRDGFLLRIRGQRQAASFDLPWRRRQDWQGRLR